MSRRFLRPFFQFWEPKSFGPFFPKTAVPGGQKDKKHHMKDAKNSFDANETFDNFFHEYYSTVNDLRKEEKQFFEKYYPERVGKKFDPYGTLKIDKSANLDAIKQAYRSEAIKYHPKVDSSEEGRRKFNDLARAYFQLSNQKRTDDNGQDVSTKSLFQDFHNQMEQFIKDQPAEEKGKQISEDSSEDQGRANMKSSQNKDESKVNQKSSSKAEEKVDQKSSKPTQDQQTKSRQKQTSKLLKGAQLYSESSYYQFVNDQRKLHVTKMYQKDGKRIKVDRLEGHLPDGSVEVTQIFDDGKQVKNRKYIQSPSKKEKRLED